MTLRPDRIGPSLTGMKYLIPITLAAAVAALLGGCGDSQESAAPDRRAVTLDALTAGPAQAGEPVTVAWRFTLSDDWHLYWTGRNDSGYPPSVALDLPPGWSAGELHWPPPERLILPGDILDHVYHQELVLLQELAPPDGWEPGDGGGFSAAVRWLACREMCVPGDTTLTVALPAAGPDPESAKVIAAARKVLPDALPDGLPVWSWAGDTLDLHLPDSRRLAYFPDRDSGALVDAIADGEADGDRLQLRFRPLNGAVGPAKGLLVQTAADGTERAYHVSLPGPTSGSP